MIKCKVQKQKKEKELKTMDPKTKVWEKKSNMNNKDIKSLPIKRHLQKLEWEAHFKEDCHAMSSNEEVFTKSKATKVRSTCSKLSWKSS